MKKDEFEAISGHDKNRNTIKVSDLHDQTPRTLIYGYTTDRDTFHLYLDFQGESLSFSKVIYDYDNVIKSSLSKQNLSEIDLVDCIPNKRVYPAASDAEFCKTLLGKGANIPFTTYEARDPMQFYGKTAVELVIFDYSIIPSFDNESRVISEFVKELGINYFEETVECVNGQIKGFFKNVLIHQKSAQESKKWLDNIGVIIKQRIEQTMPGFLSDENIAIIDNFTSKIKEEMIEAVDTLKKKSKSKNRI